MGAMMLRQHVHSVLWMSFDAVCRKQLAGVRLACSDARHSFKVTEVANMGEVETALEQCAAAGVLPDAVYAHGFCSVQAYQALAANGISPEQCRLIVTRHCWPGAGFRGLVVAYTWEQYARTLAALTLRELKAPGEVTPQYCSIPCDVVAVETAEDEQRIMPPPLPDLSS